MIKKGKKQPPVTRTPHIVRSQQSTFQYSSNRSVSDRTQREDQATRDDTTKSKRLSLPRVAVLVAIALFSVYLSVLSTSPRVAISTQEPLRSSDTYNQAAAEITGNGLLSRSKLTINRQKISQALQAQFPELTDIEVTTPLFSRSAVVKATSARPAAVLATTGKIYVLDTRGVALFDVQHKRSVIKDNNLMIINDQSGVPIVTGKPALTAAQVAFASEVKRQAEAKQLPLESMTLNAGGGELNVKHTGLGYYVRYNTNEDARKSFGTFYATKEHLERSKNAPATEYIDVRVPERAYVK